MLLDFIAFRLLSCNASFHILTRISFKIKKFIVDIDPRFKF